MRKVKEFGLFYFYISVLYLLLYLYDGSSGEGFLRYPWAMSTRVVMMIVPVKALAEHQTEANCCSLEVASSLNIRKSFDNSNSR